MDNKRRSISCRTKLDLNKTFKEATKAIGVAQGSSFLLAHASSMLAWANLGQVQEFLKIMADELSLLNDHG
ncbi:hypothetical protein JHK84_027808 [Glycine max]|nr:hypothetical protein JHK86_027686 [Glycine max]KAG5151336.1 hypothetical protein JHK84_027808 [Glycine max]